MITTGQVYLNTEANEYVVITVAGDGQVRYDGIRIMGRLDMKMFIEIFPPVDVADLLEDEYVELQGFTRAMLSTGYVGGYQ
jgi:hypothetical protein